MVNTFVIYMSVDIDIVDGRQLLKTYSWNNLLLYLRIVLNHLFNYYNHDRNVFRRWFKTPKFVFLVQLPAI